MSNSLGWVQVGGWVDGEEYTCSLICFCELVIPLLREASYYHLGTGPGTNRVSMCTTLGSFPPGCSFGSQLVGEEGEG